MGTTMNHRTEGTTTMATKKITERKTANIRIFRKSARKTSQFKI